jgi:16S rRNA processing protein RimM
LRGDFVVERPSDDPARFEVGARVWVDGKPVEIVGSKRSGGRLVVRLEHMPPRGTLLEVPVAELPAPESGSYYVFQLVGLAVEEDAGRELGRVAEVLPGVANDVLELDSGLALPLVEACVLDVDLERRRIIVAPGFAGPG